MTLLVIVGSGQEGIAEVKQQRSQAIQLTQKGHTLLEQGKATEALQTWETAAKLYRQQGNSEGVTGSLVNQSLAQKALGLNFRACQSLSVALELKQDLCSYPRQLGREAESAQRKLLTLFLQSSPTQAVRVTAMRSLGDVLRQMGRLNESEIVLQQALSKAANLTPAASNEIKLSLANTERTLSNQALNKYQLVEEYGAKRATLNLALSKAQTADTLYQQVAQGAIAPDGIAIQASLNRLSLLFDELKLVDLVKSELPNPPLVNRSQIQPLVKQLVTANFEQLPVIESVYARLSLAESLIKLSQNQENKLLEPNPSGLALKQAQIALGVAQTLKNHRTQSYALGIIGTIYTQLNQTRWAVQNLEQASALAQAIQAWDIAYKWQQQLGNLYQASGKIEQATAAYAAAVSSLEQVRGNILSTNPEIQFSFKEKVEPVYKEYLRLLLASPTPNLKQVIQTNEQLQLAELENFLQCGKLESLSLTEIRGVTPPIIHIINLDNRVEVIVQTSDGKLHRHAPNPQQVKLYSERLLKNLQSENFLYTDLQRILPSSQALYNLLIAPIKNHLPESGTLVFVLDSYFQSLPMAILHDGNDWLNKNYSISETLSSLLRQPLALAADHRAALVAGLSQASPSFSAPGAPQGLQPLPEVETEVADVKENTAKTTVLLNEQFTTRQFETEMGENDFPIVHISTHGQFSSDPQQTVLFAWDQMLDINQINRLLTAKTQGTQNPIELLVLSACQTAKGDNRSGLGIAGVAAQAGARSTVASLWLVDETSTALLMGKFYQGLNNGLTKAEALRQAQLTLMSHPKYSHPYYWLPFILVGSWL